MRLLWEAKRYIEDEKDQIVCTVCENMYFYKLKPESEQEALMCLCACRRKVAGLYFPGKNDLVYDCWTNRYTRNFASGTSLNVSRIDTAVPRSILAPECQTVASSIVSQCFGGIISETVRTLLGEIEKGVHEKTKPKEKQE